MPIYAGNSGVVRFGASGVVNEVQEFECNVEGDIIPATSMGQSWEPQLDTGRRRWSGSVTCYYDRADSDGQNAATIGASVALNLFPGGVGTGLPSLSGTALVRTREVSADKDGIVSLSFAFVGNGALTEGVQP